MNSFTRSKKIPDLDVLKVCYRGYFPMYSLENAETKTLSFVPSPLFLVRRRPIMTIFID